MLNRILLCNWSAQQPSLRWGFNATSLSHLFRGMSVMSRRSLSVCFCLLNVWMRYFCCSCSISLTLLKKQQWWNVDTRCTVNATMRWSIVTSNLFTLFFLVVISLCLNLLVMGFLNVWTFCCEDFAVLFARGQWLICQKHGRGWMQRLVLTSFGELCFNQGSKKTVQAANFS